MRDLMWAFGRGNCNDVERLAKIKPEEGTLRELIKEFLSHRYQCDNLTDKEAVLRIQQERVVDFRRDHHFLLDEVRRRFWFQWLDSVAHTSGGKHDPAWYVPTLFICWMTGLRCNQNMLLTSTPMQLWLRLLLLLFFQSLLGTLSQSFQQACPVDPLR